MRFIKGEIMHYKEAKGILSQKNNMNIFIFIAASFFISNFY